MKKTSKRKVKNEPEKLDMKKKKLITVAMTVLAALLILLTVFAFVFPIMKINSQMDEIIKTVDGMNSPQIIITDMLADNVFGQEKGEVMINELHHANELADKFCGAAKKMKYSGKNTDSLGAWDIRLVFCDSEDRVTVYMASDKIYYSVDSVEYCFVPENDEAKSEYDSFYGEVMKLLSKVEK